MTCPQCGLGFEATNPRTRYCSARCQKKMGHERYKTRHDPRTSIQEKLMVQGLATGLDGPEFIPTPVPQVPATAMTEVDVREFTTSWWTEFLQAVSSRIEAQTDQA
jgi:hypothetical protein